ncbi:capsular polysaccharide synthesis protein-domain-containing protein [Xylaria flabelliformis]|nr:capsular polysaccharide synthesis protein-domain-containing protein [Xylaria flabelliformis]
MAIQVPPEYQDKLEPIKYDDKRTDDEILRLISDYQPITSEKNIWTFWDSGIEGMPAWCRRNVISWVRICGPEWTIRVLDSIPDSPTYAGKYVPTGLPDSFYNNTLNGTHSGPHSADFLRGACLYEYGGAWVDSSTFLMRTMDDICWNQLEDPASPYRVATPVIQNNLLNCFLAARKHDPFIKRWHEIFMHVWQGRTNPDGLAQHPLLAPCVPYFLENLGEVTKGMGVNTAMDKLVEYGLQMVCWTRTTMLETDKDGFSGADYWLNNVLWIDCPKELLRPWYEEGTDFPIFAKGQEIFDLLSIKRDGPKDSPQYKAAETLVWTQLTESSMLKIGTISGMVEWVSLGTLWKRPENLGKDCEPGTFAELLRYIPLHFRQTRKGLLTVKPVAPPVTFKKGVLEP